MYISCFLMMRSKDSGRKGSLLVSQEGLLLCRAEIKENQRKNLCVLRWLGHFQTPEFVSLPYWFGLRWQPVRVQCESASPAQSWSACRLCIAVKHRTAYYISAVKQHPQTNKRCLPRINKWLSDDSRAGFSCLFSTYHFRGASAGELISRWEAETSLLVILQKSDLKIDGCLMHFINFPQIAKRALSHLPKSKTYVDDIRAGVLVIYADEKVYHELGAVFHVQLGNDILQPPQFAWRKETAGAIERRKLLVVLAHGCFTVFSLPVVHSNGPVIHIRQHVEQRGPSSLLNFTLHIYTITLTQLKM